MFCSSVFAICPSIVLTDEMQVSFGSPVDSVTALLCGMSFLMLSPSNNESVCLTACCCSTEFF